jgi:putative transposase
MKVNYPETIDLSVEELKIILSEQRTIINRQKIQVLYWLKAGLSSSLTDVAERLGVHRITVHRWLKQYSVGGLTSLLKIGQSTGRPRVIPKAIIAGLSKKLSEESCEFKSYKKICKWVEKKYQISVKYSLSQVDEVQYDQPELAGKYKITKISSL